MRISDWSSDVCSSDLAVIGGLAVLRRKLLRIGRPGKSLRPDADTDRRDLVEPPANLGMQALRRLRQGLERILDRVCLEAHARHPAFAVEDRKSTRLNSSH